MAAMAAASDPDKVARQTALSHAMGALFLESRVNELESSLQQARSKQLRGPPRRSSTHLKEASTGSLRIRQHGRSPHHSASNDHPLASSTTSSDSGKGKARERAAYADGIRVVDVSVLIYALRNVHEWIRQGQMTIIIPYSALHTLDVLKSGKELINHAARKAMSFIEKYLTDGSAFDTVQPESTASSSYNRDRRTRPGLFVQAQDEEWTTARLGELRTRKEAAEELEALINDLEADTGHSIDHDVFQLEVPPPEYDDEDDVILVQSPAAHHARKSSGERKRAGPTAGNSAKHQSAGPPVRGWRLSTRGTTPRHIRDVLSCALWTEEEAERRFLPSSRRAEDDAASDKTKKSETRDRSTPIFAFVVAYPPSALRDPRAHEDQEGTSSQNGSDHGHHQSGIKGASTVELSAQHLQATAPGAKMTRSGSIARSGGSHSSSRSGGATGGGTNPDNGSSPPATGTRLGYGSLADGLLTQRWALSFGLGSGDTAVSTEQKHHSSGGQGRRQSDTARAASAIIVLPTAASWMELAGAQRSV